MMLLFFNVAYATEAQQLFLEKINLEKQAYDLKIKQENYAIKTSQKENFVLNLIGDFNKNLTFSNSECIQWVYQGSSTREQSIEACRGVDNMDCVRWMYQGSSTREQSARACRRLESMECVKWVYQGSATREQSVQACQGVVDMECVRWAYQGSSTRVESARLCADGRGRNRPRCD